MPKEYYLLKRKNTAGEYIYHVAFLDDEIGKNGRPKYAKMISTKTTNLRTATRRAKRIATGESIEEAMQRLRAGEPEAVLFSNIALVLLLAIAIIASSSALPLFGLLAFKRPVKRRDK
jgi:hypothetical protein